MTTPDPIPLAEIEAACEAATKGPWTLDMECEVLALQDQLIAEVEWPNWRANAAFIANARTWVPAMAAEIRRLRDEKRDWLDCIHACLVAAGAPEDIDEQEQELRSTPNVSKPSHYVREQIRRKDEEIARLLVLVELASMNSVVTTSDDPGCFFCDQVDHADDCPAKEALGHD